MVIGAPAAGYRLSGPIEVEPSAVRASGAISRMAEIDTLRLGPIDLSGWTATDSFPLGVDTSGLGVIVSPMSVRVSVPVEPVTDSLGATARPLRPAPPDR